MTPAQAYRVLGLTPGCSERELTRQFRRLAQQAHPDVGGSSRRFSELSHAYVVAFEDHVAREPAVVITTHTTSLSGRIRRVRRGIQRRLHHLGVGPRHIHPNGGHL